MGKNLIVLPWFLCGCVLTSTSSPHAFDPVWWFWKVTRWLNKQEVLLQLMIWLTRSSVGMSAYF